MSSVTEEKMKVIESLKEVLKTCKEREIVKEILIAKDVKQVWLEKKEEIKPLLKKFGQSMAPYFDEGRKTTKTPFKHLPEFIDEGNIVEFCVVLMMTGAINEDDVVLEWSDVIKSLEKVTGEYEGFAKRLEEILNDGFFTDYSEEQLLKIIVP